MEGSSKLNPYATPFIPATCTMFAESFKVCKASEKQVGATEKNETADKSGRLPDSFSSYDYAKSIGELNISAESSTKGDCAGITFDPSQYEESGMDPFNVAKSVSAMFPDISADFIDEALKAHKFDINQTINMLNDLSSKGMLHDDLGLGDDYGHPAEVSESSSSSNVAQTLGNHKSAGTSDSSSIVAKSVLSMFPDISPDFIVEALKAHEYDINQTVDMLHDLTSKTMLNDNLGLGDYYDHPAEVRQSSSNLDPALQNDKLART